MRLPRRGVYKLLHQTRIGINHDEFESLIHIILAADSDLEFLCKWLGQLRNLQLIWFLLRINIEDLSN